jgi:methylmalonyl-CoA/ethylmalonyl-CoA epimerase
MLGISQIDHLGIAVSDLDSASLPYTLLGLASEGPDEEVTPQAVRVRAFRIGDSLLELLAPTSPESAIARFIAKRGPGLHHVALRVANIEAEVARLQALGADFLNTEPRAGRAGTRVVFLHPRFAGGVLIELVEHGH